MTENKLTLRHLIMDTIFVLICIPIMVWYIIDPFMSITGTFPTGYVFYFAVGMIMILPPRGKGWAFYVSFILFWPFFTVVGTILLWRDYFTFKKEDNG